MDYEPVTSVASNTGRAFGIAFAVQVLALLVVAFGDIGFDKPGRFGLDFGHFLLLAFLWFASSCAGALVAWKKRRFGLLLLQLLAFALPVAWFFRN